MQHMTCYKRARDFGVSDRLRDELRAQGVDPDTARPSDGKRTRDQYEMPPPGPPPGPYGNPYGGPPPGRYPGYGY